MADFINKFLKIIFLTENCILIKISLKCVHKGPNNNNLALGQIMVWHQTGNKPLSEPMMVWFTDAYVYYSA